ncbi:MAG: cell division protein FtsA [Marinilabiliaceae bacterium]|nr:cell division protein FtsA [Marinilabiliaceae bacterium]
MMQQSQLFAAIDIGTTKIVALVGRKNLQTGKLEVIGLEKVSSSGVKRGVVLNIEETSNAIREVVRRIETRLNIKLFEVYVGIAGQHIKSIRNRGYRFIDPSNEIRQLDVDQLFSDNFKIPIEAGEKILHVIPQDYIVDNETGIKQPVGMSGHRLEGNFHIVLGRIASVKNIEKCIHRVGLLLKGMILEPLASAQSILTEEEKEAGVVLVDIGGGTTDVAVFHDGIIQHTAVIPFGGNVVTSDIKEGCSVLTKQAETLKTRFGSAIADDAREDQVVTIPGIEGWEPKEISFKSLAYIIQARMEEIIDYVMMEIENSCCFDKTGAGIVLTGGGALLKNLAPLIKLRTGFDVRIGIPDKYIGGSLPEEATIPMFSTSFGLLMSAIDKPSQRLIEPELFGDLPPMQTMPEPKTRKKVSFRRESGVKKERREYTGNLFESLKSSFANIFEDNHDTDI